MRNLAENTHFNLMGAKGGEVCVGVNDEARQQTVCNLPKLYFFECLENFDLFGKDCNVLIEGV